MSTTTYFIESRTGEGTHANPYRYTRVAQVIDLTAARVLVDELNKHSQSTHYGFVGIVDYGALAT